MLSVTYSQLRAVADIFAGPGSRGSDRLLFFADYQGPLFVCDPAPDGLLLIVQRDGSHQSLPSNPPGDQPRLDREEPNGVSRSTPG